MKLHRLFSCLLLILLLTLCFSPAAFAEVTFVRDYSGALIVRACTCSERKSVTIKKRIAYPANCFLAVFIFCISFL